jgi:GAF domain-containing protein
MENTFGMQIIPPNEEERLAKLHCFNILNDYDETGTFKHIAAMAAHIFKVPIALVSFVDKEQVFFKGNIGMEGTDSVSRGESLCSLAILKEEATVFENAKEEPCLIANPMVAGSFGLQFYAGAPLKTSDGFNIGTVCILDKKPRKLSGTEQYLLENLASAVMDELEEKQLQINL